MNDWSFHVLVTRHNRDDYSAIASEVSTFGPTYRWAGDYEASVISFQNLFYVPGLDQLTTARYVHSRLAVYGSYVSLQTFTVNELLSAGFKELLH